MQGGGNSGIMGSGCGATLEGLDKGQGGSRGVKWVAGCVEGGEGLGPMGLVGSSVVRRGLGEATKR